jgi:hypothetical protein
MFETYNVHYRTLSMKDWEESCHCLTVATFANAKECAMQLSKCVDVFNEVMVINNMTGEVLLECEQGNIKYISSDYEE